jgi:RNA polymerase sigma-70 factor (ECF subfamily)
MTDAEGFRPSRATFPTTCWSRIIAAGDPSAPQAREALADLCATYWYPIYAYIRHQGNPPVEALDLTQDYFAQLLEKGTLAAADHRKGRFRSFLRTDCGFFLSHRRESNRALKRGGGAAPLSIDARDAEGRYLREPADQVTPELLFDRSWALSLLDGVLERLELEYAESGRSAQFEHLQVVLSEGPRSVPYATLAEQLGTTVGAVQQGVQRLRKRYRTILREHIAATLDDPSDAAVDAEIGELFSTLKV